MNGKGTGQFRLKTEGGYDFFEVLSALQKTIRRGLTEEAMYWALELLPQFEKSLWRRLIVISNEDIGIANPPVIQLIDTLSKQYFDFRERGDMGCVLMVANAILVMTRSDKSRIADHLTVLSTQERLQGKKKREIPDFALDTHTRRGKQKGRGLEHFRTVGAMLHPKGRTVEDNYEDRAYELDETAVSMKWPPLRKKSPEDKFTLFPDEE